MARELRIRFIGIAVLLYLAYISYRLYFWGDLGVSALQSAVNALADIVMALICGLVVYRMQKSAANRKYFILILLLLLGGFSVLLYSVHYFVYYAFGLLSGDFLSLFNALCFQLLDSLAIVVSGAFAVIILRQQFDQSALSKNIQTLESEKKMAELKYLKAQMEPHFVFNGLNMIYQEMELDLSARNSLYEFSRLLRYHIQYASHESIDIEEEVGYLRTYIHFQQRRCSDFLDVDAQFDIDNVEYKIEPLLLLPLVENAFKFCNGTSGGRGKIRMKLNYTHNELNFHISNTMKKNNKGKVSTGTGSGLKNVRKRLSLLYPGNHQFSAAENRNLQMFHCSLVLWHTS